MVRTLLYDTREESLVAGGQEQLARWRDHPNAVVWVDLSGLPADEEARLLEGTFGLHRLAVQDAQRDRHPPKIEAFEDHSFLLFKGLSAQSDTIDCGTIQLAAFVGPRFLATRHAEHSPSVENLRAELKRDPSPFAEGAGALALRLGRLLTQRYLKVLLALEPRLEEIEQQMLEHLDDELLGELVRHKGDLTRLRRTFHYHVQMARELRGGLLPGFDPAQEHQINDLFEQMERAASLTELYYGLASDLIEAAIRRAPGSNPRVDQPVPGLDHEQELARVLFQVPEYLFRQRLNGASLGQRSPLLQQRPGAGDEYPLQPLGETHGVHAERQDALEGVGGRRLGLPEPRAAHCHWVRLF
jgi:magnesium transporter